MPKYLDHCAEITERITKLAELPGNSLEKLLNFEEDLSAVLFKCQVQHLLKESEGEFVKYYSFDELNTQFITRLELRELRKLKRDFWKFVDTPTCSLMNQRSVVGTNKLAGGKYSTRKIEKCYSEYIKEFWKLTADITKEAVKKIDDAKAQKAEIELKKEKNMQAFEIARADRYSRNRVEVPQ